MSNISVDFDVLNQRGSPAWFTDTFANIPTAGFVGRMFISKDTFAFYRDTGSGWDLIGGPGIGTLTGSGVVGQVSFFNGTQVLAGSNNLFWDSTNSRLGINTTTPGVALDIHGTGTQLQLNGTGANNSYLTFQNAGASKWRVGNLYNAGVNTFEIYNAATSSYALTIASATNNVVLQGTLSTVGNLETQSYLYINNSLGTNQIYLPKSSGDVYGTIQTEAGGNKFSLGNISNIGTLGTPNITWTSGMQVGINNSSPTYDFDVTGTGRFTGILRLGSTLSNGTYFYTLPSATGTLALTSALSSYLPLAGGTLTGQLYINPTNTLTTGLDVASNNTSFRSDNLEGFKRQLLITMGSGTLVQLTAKGYGANYGTDLAFYTATTSGVNASPGIYITGTNNRVGIKTGTPAYDLDVSGTFGVSSAATFSSSVTAGSVIINQATTASDIILKFAIAGTPKWLVGLTNDVVDDNFTIYQDGSGGGNRFNINTNGIVLINKTATGGENARMQLNSTGQDGILVTQSTSSGFCYKAVAVSNGGTYYYILFTAGSTDTGSITSNGTTTTYAITSDYRLKQDLKDYDALNLLSKIKTYDYQWKLDNTRMYGVLAHELQDIIPYAVVGEKDAEKMQGVDYSKLIPILIKSIQELNEKLVRNNIN